MEYVDGANLKTIIESLRRQGQRMTIAHTIYIIMEVCKGLQYAHDITDPETGRAARHRPPRHLAAEHPDVEAAAR